MKTYAVKIACLVALSGLCNVRCEVIHPGHLAYDASALPDDFEFPEEMPESCTDKNVCFEQGDAYPIVTIQEALKDMPLIDVVSTMMDREGHPHCESSDCQAECSGHKPVYYIRDEKDKVRVVVQSEKLQQSVNMKWCRQEGPITEQSEHIINPQKSIFRNISCKTRYLQGFQFLVLNKDGSTERVQPKNGIPVCCSCVLKNIDVN